MIREFLDRLVVVQNRYRSVIGMTQHSGGVPLELRHAGGRFDVS